MIKRWPAALILLLGLLGGCATPRGDRTSDLEVGSSTTLGEHARIVFFGDSITEAGVGPGGYVTLVKESLEAVYPERDIEVLGAGVSGNKVTDLRARLRRDVLSKAPTHVVVYIGVNDVGQQATARRTEANGKEIYRRSLLAVLSQIRGAGAEAILCTPSVIGEDPASGSNENRLLDDYASISRTVAKQAGARVCDLRSAFKQYLQIHNPNRRHQGILTYDGVHLNEAGNRLVARQVLRALDAPDYAGSGDR